MTNTITIGELRRMGDTCKENSSPIDVYKLPFEDKIQMIRDGIFHKDLMVARVVIGSRVRRIMNPTRKMPRGDSEQTRKRFEKKIMK